VCPSNGKKNQKIGRKSQARRQSLSEKSQRRPIAHHEEEHHMKTALFAAALAAFIPVVASASVEDNMSTPFANPQQFSALYQWVDRELVKAGVTAHQGCDPSGYSCGTSRSWKDGDSYLAAYNITNADGSQGQEICFGDRNSRRCGYSDGRIYDQNFQGGVWVNVRTIANGFAN
jgi:hypothetical protein